MSTKKTAASTSTPTTYTLTVPDIPTHTRIDAFIAQQLPNYSRTAVQKLIDQGMVTCNNITVTKPRELVTPGNIIVIRIPEAPRLGTPVPFTGDLGVTVVFEHPDFMIINKPAGLVVHTSRRTDVPETSQQLEHHQPTLVDWLLTHFHNLAAVGSPNRPGIVHRLDKDTSGLMIVAKNPQALATLSELFKQRKIQKTYWAVVTGHPPREGTIDLPIDRHPTIRHRMTHLPTAVHWQRPGRHATTHYKVIEQFANAALLELTPVTGRTHQIRVHCAAIKHPLLGDAVYGKKSSLIGRHALHAYALAFEYEGKQYRIHVAPPEDFQKLLDQLATSLSRT